MTQDRMLNIRLTEDLLYEIEAIRVSLNEKVGQMPSKAFVIRMALTKGLKEIRKES